MQKQKVTENTVHLNKESVAYINEISQWQQRRDQDPSEYAANVLLSGKPIDGLFVALAVAMRCAL